jgi:hypothetical protein
VSVGVLEGFTRIGDTRKGVSGSPALSRRGTTPLRWYGDVTSYTLQ